MIDITIIWDPDDDPDGNVKHIARHRVTKGEVEEVLRNPRSRTARSRRTGLPMVFGWTSTGRYLTVIWQEDPRDPRTVKPKTAYDVPPPQGRQQ